MITLLPTHTVLLQALLPNYSKMQLTPHKQCNIRARSGCLSSTNANAIPPPPIVC